MNREKLLALIRTYGEAQFDCGEHDQFSDESYDSVFERAHAAYQAIMAELQEAQ